MSYNKHIKILCICTSLPLQIQTKVSKLKEKITLNFHVNTNDTSLSANKILFRFPFNRSRVNTTKISFMLLVQVIETNELIYISNP